MTTESLQPEMKDSREAPHLEPSQEAGRPRSVGTPPSWFAIEAWKRSYHSLPTASTWRAWDIGWPR
jgi:hypothetical protein